MEESIGREAGGAEIEVPDASRDKHDIYPGQFHRVTRQERVPGPASRVLPRLFVTRAQQILGLAVVAMVKEDPASIFQLLIGNGDKETAYTGRASEKPGNSIANDAVLQASAF